MRDHSRCGPTRRTSCRICPPDYDRILGDAHRNWSDWGTRSPDLPSHRPNVVRRANDLKAELAGLPPHGGRGRCGAAGRGLFQLDTDVVRIDPAAALAPRIFQVAADDINYRRFFNINELAGLRMEQPELFDLTHRFVLEKIGDGTLDGLRIDHIDGLLDPKSYCVRLREKAARPFYLVVEKILARHEHLREDWPIEGTTGYEFANLVGGLFVDPAGEKAFSLFYREFTGQRRAFEDIVRECKILIMDTEMASELNVLARDAGRIARSNRRTCDFTDNILHVALREIVARFPVYRTYIDGTTPSEADRRESIGRSRRRRRTEHAPDASVLRFPA